MEEWVYMVEDEPLLDKRYKRCSIAINVLTDTGNVIKDCFMTLDDKEVYDNKCKKIKEEVVAWQTAS